MEDYLMIEASCMENGSYRALATRLMASVKGSLDCRLPLEDITQRGPKIVVSSRAWGARPSL
jgi:hypothetical protein